MFESVRAALDEQINTCAEALTVAGVIRDHIDVLAVSQNPPTGFEDSLRTNAPKRKPWLIYDHCAALTRIYSILEIFISSLSREICGITPDIHARFSELPKRTRTAYRKGYAKILIDIDDKHHLQNIDLADISRTVTQGLCDEQPYKLSPEPFLANKRAFRLPQIAAHLIDLGFSDIESSLAAHPSILSATADHEDGESRYMCLQRKLNDFINARNEAAHTDVTAIWPQQKVRDAAYLIRDLCFAVLDVTETQLIQARFSKDLLTSLGQVSEVHSSRKGIIFTPPPCSLRVDTDIILVRGTRCFSTVVRSIQIDGNSHTGYTLDGETEVGLLLGTNSRVGDGVYLIGETTALLQVPLSFGEADYDDIYADEELSTDEVYSENDGNAEDEPQIEEPPEPARQSELIAPGPMYLPEADDNADGGEDVVS